MIDLSFSRERDQKVRAAVWARQRRMIIPLVAAFILLAGGLSIVWGFGGNRVPAPSSSAVSSPAREQVANELLRDNEGA